MKNKDIIEALDKVRSDNKDIIYKKLYRPKNINFKYTLALVSCLVIIFLVSYKPQDGKITPLTTNENTDTKISCDEECQIEKEKE